jgi:type I protein arginine methyltransferase
MYSLDDYGHMIADAGRIRAYGKAIGVTVHPGDVVAEIGCGPGIFALLACRAGAKRVYAIDQEEIVYLARQLAVANEFSDRIEIIQADSRKVELHERVNVIVSDIRGVLPLFGHAVPTMEDARRRFLAPGGIVIPQRDILRAAVVDAGDFYSQLTSAWQSVDGLDLSPSLSLILNEYYTVRFKPDQLLTEATSWGVLDYTAAPETRAAAELNLRAVRPGIANGLALWFDTELFNGIGYSSGPSGTAVIYGQVFLPWLEPVEVDKGAEIRVVLCADPVGGNYVWRWETNICARNRTGHNFRQSTFQGASFTPNALRRRAADFVPILSDNGLVDRWLLQAMDGKTSLQQMAQIAAARFPTVFPRWEDALHRAAELAERFSR